jgi:GNAT superfamily N-acetyltransferase
MNLKKNILERIISLENIHAHYMFTRVQVMEKVKSNPFNAASGIHQNRYFCSIETPSSPLLNRAGGFEEFNKSNLLDLISWYRCMGRIPRLTVIPEFHSEEFIQLLSAAQFKHSKIWDTSELWAKVEEIQIAKSNENIIIREIKNQEEANVFAEIYVDSFNFKDNLRDGMKENMKQLFNSDTKLYMGWFNGHPASVGILHILEEIGYLAMTGTLKKYRGKGLHTAMIHYRVKEAKENGVQIISGSAARGSISQKNMERNGLKLSHIQETWALTQFT